MRPIVLAGSVLRPGRVVIWSRLIFTLYILFLIPLTNVRGERVGFRFSGFTNSASTLFNVSVAKNSPITGTFSYDVTSAGIAVDQQTKTYHQLISGGYTLNINNGTIRLSASDYIITVANDLEQTPSPVDQFIVDYDSRLTPTPAPIIANGASWSGIAAIRLELSWPSTNFTDPDEPKLTADRPLSADRSVFSYVGSSPALRFLTITSIASIAAPTGDYNFDGTVNTNDYIEWQNAFGQMGEDFQYADGNHDGVIDAADYTVWRDLVGTTESFAAAVPEPGSLFSLTIGLVLVTIWCQARRR